MCTKEFTVLTLNCWGVFTPGASQKRFERLAAIGEALSHGKHDIILLQEIWTDGDFENMKKCLGTQYPHNNYFHSNLIGSGLCIFSKFHIIDTLYQPYALNGYAHRVYHGDWFGGKGVAMAKLKTEDGFLINVYMTHMHAQYKPTDDTDDYRAHRVSQAFQLSQFVRLTAPGSDVVIVGGDINLQQNSLGYATIVNNAGLKDAWLTQRIVPENPEVTGATSDRPGNSFQSASWAKFFPNGERLDYIFYKNNSGCDIVCQECFLTLGTIPGQDYNYSDHEGVEAKFLLKRSPTMEGLEPDHEARSKVCQQIVTEMDKGLTRVFTDRLMLVGILLCSLLIGLYSPSFLQDICGSLLSFLSGMVFFIALWIFVVSKTAERRGLMNSRQDCLFIINAKKEY